MAMLHQEQHLNGELRFVFPEILYLYIGVLGSTSFTTVIFKTSDTSFSTHFTVILAIPLDRQV